MVDYLSYFSNLENGELILRLIDGTIFLFFAIAVLYLFFFAVKSVPKPKNVYPKAAKKYKYVVMFPAYNEDNVIINSVQNFFETQKYPRENYDILVISDTMTEKTDSTLRDLGALVCVVKTNNSTKTNALHEGVTYVDNSGKKYDNVVILDADNLVSEDFLDDMNDAFYSGCSAIQTHRVAKNKNTSVAVLDAVSEEINNSIFRKGHTRVGFSAGLIGSGMAFEYDLFKECIMHATHVGVDKQLELLLISQQIYIEYLNDVFTYDEKVKNSSQFYSQRRRWVSTQFHNLFRGLITLPSAIFNSNWDYCDKVLQWTMPPRVILLGIITIVACILTLCGSTMAIKWWCLLALLGITFALAIPDYLVNGKLLKAIFKLPFLFLLMFLNTFRVVGANKRFIHTEHSE